MPPPIPPSRPATAGLTPTAVVAVSISEAVNRRTAPLVEASIQAYGLNISDTEAQSHGSKRVITYPRNESLVETCDTSSTPNGLDGLEHRLRPIGGHLRLEHLKRLTQCRDFLRNRIRQHRESERTFEVTLTNCTLNRAELRITVSKDRPDCRG